MKEALLKKFRQQRLSPHQKKTTIIILNTFVDNAPRLHTPPGITQPFVFSKINFNFCSLRTKSMV
jgi:hypothetical protein